MSLLSGISARMGQQHLDSGTAIKNKDRLSAVAERQAHNTSEEKKTDLKSSLLSQVKVASPQESAKFFDGAADFRWGETLIGDDAPGGVTTIHINDAKFRDAGSVEFRDKMILGESLHTLKNVDPERYRKLQEAALSSPEYIDWMKNSYQRATNEGEKRGIAEWHDQSRFDQVIGGYLFAGDKDIPTMKNWNRETLPFGNAFKAELEKLRIDLKLD